MPAAPMRDPAPYATQDGASRGRRHPEPPPRERSEFQRDRDRIIHSTAFRRLEYKTQVFLNHEGDHFRTRLTHSLEVAQIARSICGSLGLNEALAEAIALAHDLGHTPFGHAGQDALNECMGEHGGFEHNLQSLRVVDLLEQRYAEFDGLNLCFETREGILKHCSPARARELGDVGERFLTDRRPSLEAQVNNLADEIAYNNHDVDDGLRSGFISLDELAQVPIVERHLGLVKRLYPAIDARRLVHETVRRMIDTLVTDLVAETGRRIRDAAPASLDEVRAAPPLVSFSAEVRAESRALKQFLMERLYRHHRVRGMASKARRIVGDLFRAFTEDVALLPPEFQARAGENRARAVADYVAGMTDRFAMREHRRLFAVEDV